MKRYIRSDTKYAKDALQKLGIKEGKVGNAELKIGYGPYQNRRYEIWYDGSLAFWTSKADSNLKDTWNRYCTNPPETSNQKKSRLYHEKVSELKSNGMSDEDIDKYFDNDFPFY